jgi:hypothetical protein
LVLAWAREAGRDAERLERTPGTPSVLVRARGRGGGRSLLLCGHTDTVGAEGMSDPHRPRVEGERLFERLADRRRSPRRIDIAPTLSIRGSTSTDYVNATVATGGPCNAVRRSEGSGAEHRGPPARRVLVK